MLNDIILNNIKINNIMVRKESSNEYNDDIIKQILNNTDTIDNINVPFISFKPIYFVAISITNLFEQEISLVVEFPFTVTKEVVQKLITKEREDNMGLRGMYV